MHNEVKWFREKMVYLDMLITGIPKQILVKSSAKNSHNLENINSADGITEFSTLYL